MGIAAFASKKEELTSLRTRTAFGCVTLLTDDLSLALCFAG